MSYICKMRTNVKQYSDKILELFDDGMRATAIATFLNLKPTSVSGILLKTGRYSNPKIDNPYYFSKIDSHNKAYILGFIAADGCLTKSKKAVNYALRIKLDESDEDVLHFIKKEFQSNHPVLHTVQKCDYKTKKELKQVVLAITHDAISSNLIRLGITPRKSKTLSNVLNNIPFEFRKSFILGYFDGDGCITFSKDKPYIMIRGTEELLRGIIDSLELESYSLKKYDSTWRLVMGSKKAIKTFYGIYGYSDFFLKRKYDKFSKDKIKWWDCHDGCQ